MPEELSPKLTETQLRAVAMVRKAFGEAEANDIAQYYRLKQRRVLAQHHEASAEAFDAAIKMGGREMEVPALAGLNPERQAKIVDDLRVALSDLEERFAEATERGQKAADQLAEADEKWGDRLEKRLQEYIANADATMTAQDRRIGDIEKTGFARHDHHTKWLIKHDHTFTHQWDALENYGGRLQSLEGSLPAPLDPAVRGNAGVCACAHPDGDFLTALGQRICSYCGHAAKPESSGRIDLKLRLEKA